MRHHRLAVVLNDIFVAFDHIVDHAQIIEGKSHIDLRIHIGGVDLQTPLQHVHSFLGAFEIIEVYISQIVECQLMLVVEGDGLLVLGDSFLEHICELESYTTGQQKQEQERTHIRTRMLKHYDVRLDSESARLPTIG